MYMQEVQIGVMMWWYLISKKKKKYCYYTRSAKSANETLPMQKDQRLLPQYNKDGVTILNQL